MFYWPFRRWRADLSEGEARAILEDCMRVLWYRDTRALNRVTIAKVRCCCCCCTVKRDSRVCAPKMESNVFANM